MVMVVVELSNFSPDAFVPIPAVRNGLPGEALAEHRADCQDSTRRHPAGGEWSKRKARTG